MLVTLTLLLSNLPDPKRLSRWTRTPFPISPHTPSLVPPLVLARAQFTPPGELLEGYTRSVDENPLSRLFSRGAADVPPDRMELDLEDSKPFNRQLYDQVRSPRREGRGRGGG